MGGQGSESPPKFGVGVTLMQIAPPPDFPKYGSEFAVTRHLERKKTVSGEGTHLSSE